MKKRGFLLVNLVIVVALFIAGCASDKAWERTRQANNYAAYSEYIKENPRGRHVGEARTEILKSYRLTDEEIAKVAKLQRERSPEARNIEYIDKLIFTGANCLNSNAFWVDQQRGRQIYDMLKNYDSQTLADSMTRVVLIQIDRLKVLFLIVKLGVHGTQQPLNNLLMRYGDKSMAEDYLNCGSRELYEGGAAWGRSRGMYIRSGPGSHRVGWGNF